MAYEVLARKWRPQKFEDVVGQDHVVRTLKNAIAEKRVAQAYLFAGPRGTGKTTLARIFAKALNCVNGPTPEPCGVCDSCVEIANGVSLDVAEMDGASNNKVEDVHTVIIDKINFMPVGGKHKIFYIDEVHMLTASAFNPLLKNLEEPPEHVKFIFATTEPDKVLGTILSRCQRFDLRRIGVPTIVKQLRKIADAENIKVDDEALLAVASGADGGMRDAESALDQLIAFTGGTIAESDVLGVFGLVARAAIEEIAGAILRGDTPAILRHIATLDDSGKDLRKLVAELIAHFRNLMVCVQLKGDISGLDLTDAQAQVLKTQAQETNASAALAIAETLIELEGALRNAFSQRIMIETALIRCARASAMTDLETVLKALSKLELQTPPPHPSPPQPPPPIPAPPKKTNPETPTAAEPASSYPKSEADLNEAVIENPVVKEAVKMFNGIVEAIERTTDKET